MPGVAVVQLSDFGQPVEVRVHREVLALAEARDDDLVMEVTLFVHRHPGVARSAGSYRWRHEVSGQRSGQLWRKEEAKEVRADAGRG